MWLLVIAILGMLLPNGVFLYWLLQDYSSLSAAFSDKLALAFVLDVFGATALLTYLFARKPVGPVRWPWFLGLSLIGTLCFSIPLYLWLNWRHAAKPGLSFTAWWRAV
jgi:hypothetical protein